MKTAIKRPIAHYIIIGGYVFAPLLNILFYARSYHVPFTALVQNFFIIFGTFSGILLIAEPLVGLSLFFIHRFSWYIFVMHSSLILIDNFYKLFKAGGTGIYQWSVLAGSAAWIAVIAYVLRKDFRAPYFQAIPRSWREKRRVPIHHYIWLSGEQKEIGDFSASGCFVNDSKLGLRLGERVPIRLSLEKQSIDFSCEGEVVRITEAGLGIRFVDVPRREQKRLDRFFRLKFPLRYAVGIDCIWQGSSAVAARAKTVDVSRDGCFIAADTAKFSVNEKGTLQLRIGQDDFELDCKIIWINEGSFIKPLGVGIEFKDPQRRMMRKLHAAYSDLPLTR